MNETHMSRANRWVLPEGVEVVLPREAFALETMRRRLLDLYQGWGYQLVITPMIEYLDSLLVGTSHDLDLHTFKITDQLSGRMMGIRADMTPQVARIDAHDLQNNGPVRLCYADTVLHTRPRGLQTSRVPIRVGAELFGHAGVACDVELICLMYATLQAAEVPDVHLVLGHVGIFRALVTAAELSTDAEQALFEAMQRKAYGEIAELLNQTVSDGRIRAWLNGLSRLSGDEDTLERAVETFAAAPESVQRAVAELGAIQSKVKARLPEARVSFDLSELRGYAYHTGIVFAAYSPSYGRAVAKGGRYDDIGEVFGRARPASGFDCDLKTLARLSRSHVPLPKAILAPADDEPSLLALIESLRGRGEVVIVDLDPEVREETMTELNCDRRITKISSEWRVIAVETHRLPGKPE